MSAAPSLQAFGGPWVAMRSSQGTRHGLTPRHRDPRITAVVNATGDLGATANSYQMLAKLAVGGMAEIFLVRRITATGVERYCVLKQILPERARDARFVQMFLDEARLATQLQHPNIASVYDIGTLGDSYFYTMEYVHGQTIRSVLERAHDLKRPVPLACVSTVIAGVAAALHHAHERNGNDGRPLGIVHRDVSPSNLMVSYEGNVKLVDFGVAKATDRVDETKSGTVKGKISYLSPEQCHGERVDRRSDLFSLGIVMWEMLTGERLYRRASDFENMAAIVHETPARPSLRRPEVSRAIDTIVMRLLAKAPGDRFQTAAEVVEALENASMQAGTMLSTAAVRRLVHDFFGAPAEPWLVLERDRWIGHTVRPMPDPPVIGASPTASTDARGSSIQLTHMYMFARGDVGAAHTPPNASETMSIEISASMLTQASTIGHAASPGLAALAPRTFPPSKDTRPTLLGVSPAPPAIAPAFRPSRASSDHGGAAMPADLRKTRPRGLRSRVAWIAAPALLLLAAAIGFTARSPAVQVAQDPGKDPGSATARAPGTVAPAEPHTSPAPAAAERPHAEPVAAASPAQDAPVAVPERPRDAEPPSAPPRNEAVPQRPAAGDAVPARRPPIASPTRSPAIGAPARSPAAKPPAAAAAESSPDSIHALFDAKNYARVVRACSEMPVTAAIANLCVLAACQVNDEDKAQRWLSISPAESTDKLVDTCKRRGHKLTRRPSLDCSNDPLDCR